MARKHVVGRPIASPLRMPAVRREIRERLDEKMAKGFDTGVWGKGVFMRHVALGLFEHVSLCGRFIGSTNTAAMPTLIGMCCPRCMRIWNRAMDVHNAAIEAENENAISTLAGEMAELVKTGDVTAARVRWNDGTTRALRAAVLDRLNERGLDLTTELAR